MKKAQTEIIGLVLIVLIISVGMIFYLKLRNTEEEPNMRQDFTDTKLASNTLSVLLRTTHPYLEVEIRNLWQACIENRRVAAEDACSNAYETSKDILTMTLDEFDRDFFFNVTGGDTSREYGSPCPFEKQTETFFLPSDEGPIEITLEICR